jgi:hypothetical protein
MLPIVRGLSARIAFLEMHGDGSEHNSKISLRDLPYEILLDLTNENKKEMQPYWLSIAREEKEELKEIIESREADLDNKGQRSLECNVSSLVIRQQPMYFSEDLVHTITLRELTQHLPRLTGCFDAAVNMQIDYDAFEHEHTTTHILFSMEHDAMYRTELKIQIDGTGSTWTVFLDNGINIPIFNTLALKGVFQECQMLFADYDEEAIAVMTQRKYTKSYQRVLYDNGLRSVSEKLRKIELYLYRKEFPLDIKRKIFQHWKRDHDL